MVGREPDEESDTYRRYTSQMSGFIKPCFIEAQSLSFICIELLSQDSNRVEKL